MAAIAIERSSLLRLNCRSCSTMELAMAQLQRDWRFRPSQPNIKTRLNRIGNYFVNRREFPKWEIAQEPVSAERWIVYFLFSLTGSASAAHKFTLSRLREENAKLLVVATGLKPAENSKLLDMVDALILKDNDGYDFSAYSIGLDVLTENSPGADIFFINDSVLGPFSNIGKLVWQTPWDFTGMLASAECENHIQSFAFSIKNCTRQRQKALDPLFTLNYAYNKFGDVVALKETQMARIAAKTMSVGARWYSPSDFANNASMERPFDLISSGFPFLKKANLEKHAYLHDQTMIKKFLKNNNHPPL